MNALHASRQNGQSVTALIDRHWRDVRAAYADGMRMGHAHGHARGWRWGFTCGAIAGSALALLAVCATLVLQSLRGWL